MDQSSFSPIFILTIGAAQANQIAGDRFEHKIDFGEVPFRKVFRSKPDRKLADHDVRKAMVAPAAPRVRTIRACRCIDQEPRIETIASHLARRVEKIERKHHVTQNEVREILRTSSHFRFVEKGHRGGQNVYSALGQTSAGRYLIVFFVRKKTGQALPISARDMTSGEGDDMRKSKSSISKARSYAESESSGINMT